jgi:hypothetical protein
MIFQIDLMHEEKHNLPKKKKGGTYITQYYIHICILLKIFNPSKIISVY